MNQVIILTFIVFFRLTVASNCDWTQTWSGTCLDKETKNYYFLSNYYNQNYVQRNYFDCSSSNCSESWGTYFPANATVLFQQANGTTWSILTYELFWDLNQEHKKNQMILLN